MKKKKQNRTLRKMTTIGDKGTYFLIDMAEPTCKK